MIVMERINSQLSLLREKVIVSVDPGGGGMGGVGVGGRELTPRDILCVAQVGH